MRHEFPDIARLEHIAIMGAVADVGPGSDLEQEIAYGNHSGAKYDEEEVREELIAKLVLSRSLAIPLAQAEGIRGI